MDITMQIIWDHLPSDWSARQFGRFHPAALEWPEILDCGKPAAERAVYIASPQMLPQVPAFPVTSLLLCAGECENAAYQKGNFPFIQVADVGFAELFHAVQGIYRKLHRWEKECSAILHADADIGALLKISLPILQNPITVADRHMRYLGSMPEGVQELQPTVQMKSIDSQALKEGNLDGKEVNSICNRIAHHGYDVHPRLCHDFDDKVYNIDLFHAGLHIGQLSITNSMNPFRPSDPLLLQMLARILEKSFQRRSTILEEQTNSLKNIITELLNGNQVAKVRLQRAVFAEGPHKSPGGNGRYQCIKVIQSSGNSKVPVSYICNCLEELLPGCVATEYNSLIVAVLDLTIYPGAENAFVEPLESYLKQYELCAGISNTFDDLHQLRSYFRQACAALETGKAMGRSAVCYRFEQYALPYMLLHSTGEFTTEQVCPRGLIALRKYNEDASVDYWHVLQTYLNTGCNAAETSRLLYLHRSTLLKRLEKISQILGMDLNDQAQMLHLGMCVQLLNMDEGKRAGRSQG